MAKHWRSVTTIPRTGVPIIVLLGKQVHKHDDGSEYTSCPSIFGCRFGEHDWCGEITEGWFDLDWVGLVFEEDANNLLGWIPFPESDQVSV